MRVILRQLFTLIVGVLLALLFAGLLLMAQGMPADRAFLVEGPNLIFVFMDIGLVIFMALLIIGGIRRQGLGAGRAGTILAAVVAALGNLVVITVLVMQAGQSDYIAIGIGAQAGAAVVAGVGIATVLADRLWPLPPTTPVDAPAAGAAVHPAVEPSPPAAATPAGSPLDATPE